MSCKECNEFQQTLNSYFYRWKNANVEIRGCQEHVKEVMDVLNGIQKEPLFKSTEILKRLSDEH